MNAEQFQTLLDTHGANTRRWPADQAAAARDLTARDPHAAAMLRAARRLSDLLDGAGSERPIGIDDILRRARQLPQEPAAGVTVLAPRRTAWRRPTAWRPAAALAASLLAGFLVGQAGLLPTSGKGMSSFEASIEQFVLSVDATDLEDAL